MQASPQCPFSLIYNTDDHLIAVGCDGVLWSYPDREPLARYDDDFAYTMDVEFMAKFGNNMAMNAIGEAVACVNDGRLYRYYDNQSASEKQRIGRVDGDVAAGLAAACFFRLD